MDPKSVEVYLETGQKRTFACAIEWPGWCRAGRDDAAALSALAEYAPRYERALALGGVAGPPPVTASELVTVERLAGDSTTDFGAPGVPPKADSRPVDQDELRRLQAIVRAAWSTLDAAVASATGKELRRGPRDGGRDVGSIIAHVRDGMAGYVYSIGSRLPPAAPVDDQAEAAERDAVLAAMAAMARGEVDMRGPRGGQRWTARYFARRLAWHVLDHAWEIEDRILPG